MLYHVIPSEALLCFTYEKVESVILGWKRCQHFLCVQNYGNLALL